MDWIADDLQMKLETENQAGSSSADVTATCRFVMRTVLLEINQYVA